MAQRAAFIFIISFIKAFLVLGKTAEHSGFTTVTYYALIELDRSQSEHEKTKGETTEK